MFDCCYHNALKYLIYHLRRFFFCAVLIMCFVLPCDDNVLVYVCFQLCCDCCDLGLQASRAGESCGVMDDLLDRECREVFSECCSGNAYVPPPTAPAPTTTAPPALGANTGRESKLGFLARKVKNNL